MGSFTRDVLPEFDFSEAATLSVAGRISHSIEKARELAANYPIFGTAPAVSTAGATKEELDELNVKLDGNLDSELRQFHSSCRFLCIDDGLSIGGFDHNGTYPTEPHWISNEHSAGNKYLVFGAYWRYADGDQLLIDLDDPKRPVVAYLHEHGPLFEYYAPTFSFALWRMTHESIG